MLKISDIKKLICVLISLVFICFAGCNKAEQYSLVKTENVNYNNIYDVFAHSRLWVNEASVYFAKSGLYNDTYYYADENGKHKITSDGTFNPSSDIELKGKLSGIQAYGNDVYLLYRNDAGTNLFYIYTKGDKTFKELLCTEENVDTWTVFDNQLIFSAFEKNKDIGVNSLWICDLNDGKLNQIAAETIAFGIMNDTLCYIQKSNDNKCTLYNFDPEKGNDKLKCSFKYSNETYNEFNFTSDSIVFFKNGLNVLNVESGDLKCFDLMGYARFMSCYEEYAFVCLENELYRINLNTGESELVLQFDESDECNLVHAIGDDRAVIVCYENADSLFKFAVKTYAVNSEGTVKELFVI